jgi:hypothetical protein
VAQADSDARRQLLACSGSKRNPKRVIKAIPHRAATRLIEQLLVAIDRNLRHPAPTQQVQVNVGRASLGPGLALLGSKIESIPSGGDCGRCPTRLSGCG